MGRRAVALAGVDGADPTERLEAALDGELRADILRTFARRVAVGIEPVLAIIDPGVLVIGGPVGTLGGEDLAEYVAEELHEHTQWRQLVRASGIERDPVLRGAKHVLVEQVRQHLLDQVGA
jgi:predicted NBD/HSP70 family sugar kinase